VAYCEVVSLEEHLSDQGARDRVQLITREVFSFDFAAYAMPNQRRSKFLQPLLLPRHAEHVLDSAREALDHMESRPLEDTPQSHSPLGQLSHRSQRDRKEPELQPEKLPFAIPEATPALLLTAI